MDETILKELREIKETLQTIASSLECDKDIDIAQPTKELDKPWRVGDMKAVINLDIDEVVKIVLHALARETNIEITEEVYLTKKKGMAKANESD